MLEFCLPINVEDLEVPSNDKFSVQQKYDIESFGEDQLLESLKGIAKSLSFQPDSVVNNDNFDALFSVVTSFGDCSDKLKSRSCDILVKGYADLLVTVHGLMRQRDEQQSKALHEDFAAHVESSRNAIKMYSLLLCTLVNNLEKMLRNQAIYESAPDKSKDAEKSKSAFDWDQQKEVICSLLVGALEEDNVFSLWKMNAPEESFGMLFFKLSNLLLETPSNLKNKALKPWIYRLFVSSVLRFHMKETGTTAIVHLLHNFENLPPILAELMEVFAKPPHKSCGIIENVLHEIGRMDVDLLARDAAGARNVSLFLTSLAERIPLSVRPYVPLLMRHMDGECYPMRNGIIQMIGKLVQHSVSDEEYREQVIEEEKQALQLMQQQKNGRQTTAVKSKKPKPARRRRNRGSDDDDESEESAEENDENEEAENGENMHPNVQQKQLETAALGKPAPAPAPVPSVPEMPQAELYEVLESRVHDVSSYTRSKVLQTWIELIQADALPKEKMSKAVELATDRLADKTSMVRKNACVLLTALLEHQPFFACLSLHLLQQQLDLEARNFKQLIDDLNGIKAAEGVKQQEGAVQEVEKNAAKPDKKKGRRLSAKVEPMEEEAVAKEWTEEEKQMVAAKEQQLQQLLLAVQFVTSLEQAVSPVCELLASKTSSDVLAAVSFFSVAYQFRLDQASKGTRRMLELIWTKDKNIQDSVLEAFRHLYLGDAKAFTGPHKQKAALYTAKSLVKLTVGATVAEVTSLEELLLRMMKNDDVPSVVISALFDIFQNQVDGAKISVVHASGALQLLGMLGTGKPSLLVKNMKEILSVGLGPRSTGYLYLARAACVCLQKIPRAVFAADVPPLTQNVLFSKLLSLCKRGMLNNPLQRNEAERRTWFPTAEQAINTIFALHPHPDQCVEGLIKQMKQMLMLPNGELGGEDNNAHNTSSVELSPATPVHTLLPHHERVSRMFFVVGHVSVKMLLQLEITETALKQARQRGMELKEASKNKEQEASKKGKKKGDTAPAKESTIEEDLAEGASQDYQIECMRADAEAQLLAQQVNTWSQAPVHSLLGSFVPMLLHVCRHPAQYPHANLQASSVLTLCKFMTVTADFAEPLLPLLFTLLQQAQDAKTRANVVIALGDMSHRFPNLIEPWSSHIFARLRDNDSGVRKSTLTVLSHLILNDMIKVKGPVSEIAKCLEDKDSRLSDLAKVFFQELARKGNNPVYNVLPDIISRLSSDPRVSHASFQLIMKFLLGFISKEKHIESLVDKLCHRFANTVETLTTIEDLDGLLDKNAGNHLIKRLDEQNQGVKLTIELDFSRNLEKLTGGRGRKGKDKQECVEGVVLKIALMTTEEMDEMESQSSTSSTSDVASMSSASSAVSTVEGESKEGAKKPVTDKEVLRKASIQAWRDVAYCLSLINYNAASFKKLMTAYPSYAQHLFDAQIYNSFTTIVTKAKKVCGGLKADQKEMVTEFEAMITVQHNKGAEDEESSLRAAAMKKRKGGKKSSVVLEDDEEESKEGVEGQQAGEDEEEAAVEEPINKKGAKGKKAIAAVAPPAKATKGKKAAAAPVTATGKGKAAASKKVAAKKPAARAAPARGRRKAAAESSEDSSSEEESE